MWSAYSQRVYLWPKAYSQMLCIEPKAKVSITLVPEELQTFCIGFFGVEFDFQLIGTIYNPVVSIILGGK